MSLRALDLLDKVAHRHPERVQPYKHLFIGPLADREQGEQRLQVVRTLPRLRWTPRERPRVVAILRRDAAHPQLFVRAWALDSLATLAESDRSIRPFVFRLLRAFAASGRPALMSRSRNIRRRLVERSAICRPREPFADERLRGASCLLRIALRESDASDGPFPPSGIATDGVITHEPKATLQGVERPITGAG